MSFIRELRAKFTAGAEGFRRTIADVREDMHSIGDAADTGTQKAESGFTRLKNNIMGFGAAYLGFEAVKEGVVGLGEAMIGGNADMETYQNTLSQVMHSNEKAAETIQWATQFAAKTPFEIPDIVEATTKLEIYGLKSKDTLGTIGDMASVMGKPLMQAVEAIADAQTGELERLKEFGITKQMLIDQAAKMGKTEVVNAQGQITDQKALNDALFALMQERYQGGMELQSKTFKGMVSNIQDSMGTMARELGKPIFDKVKQGAQNLMPILSALTSVIVGDTAGAFETLRNAVGDDMANKIMNFITTAKNGFTAVANTVMALWPSIINILKTVWNVAEPFAIMIGVTLVGAFKLLSTVVPPILQVLTGITAAFTGWEGFTPLVIGLTAAFGAYKAVVMAAAIQSKALSTITKLQTAYQYALNLAMSLNPIGLVVAALVGLAVALVVAYKKSETFRNIVNGAWTALKAGFAAVVNWFTTTLPEWVAGIVANFKKLTSFLTPIINAYKTLIVNTWNNIKLLVLSIVGVFLSLLTGDFEGLKVALQGIVTAIKRQFSDTWNAIKTIVLAVVNGLKSGVVAGFNAIRSGAIAAVNGMKTGISNGINAVKGFFTRMKSDVVSTIKSIDLFQIGKNIIQGLINGVGSMGRALTNKVKDLAGNITDSIKKKLGIHSPSTVFHGFGVNLGEGLRNGIDKSKKMISRAATGLAGLAMDPFGGLDGAPVMSASLAAQTAAGAATGAGTQYNAPLMHVENQYVNDQNDVREISTGLYGLQRSHDRSRGRR